MFSLPTFIKKYWQKNKLSFVNLFKFRQLQQTVLLNIAQAHLLLKTDNERQIVKQVNLFKELRDQGQEFFGFVLSYDFYKSEKYFQDDYSLIVEEIFPIIDKIAFQYGFRWKGGFCGDGAFFCLANSFDHKLNLSRRQALSNVCRFSYDLFCLFRDLDYQSASEEIRAVTTHKYIQWLKDLVVNNQAQFLLLRIGISFGRLQVGNSLSTLTAVSHQPARPFIESARLASYAWGVHLARNHVITQYIRSLNLPLDQTIIAIDNNLILLQFDKIEQKNRFYSGYRVFGLSYDQRDIIAINCLIAKISTWSEHNHFEGNYASHQQESPSQSQISLRYFIDRFETWHMQWQLLRICKQIQDPRARYQAMLVRVQEFTQNVIKNLRVQSIQHGYLMISPFNLSADSNNLTDLTFQNLSSKVSVKIGPWPKYFQALRMSDYLQTIKAVLQTSPQCQDLELVFALRRDRVERWYLEHPNDSKTGAFIEELIAFKNQGLIAGVDIAGVEREMGGDSLKPFLERLHSNGLLHSIHAGEVPEREIYIGICNIIEAVKAGAKRIGQGYVFYYLLNANRLQQQLLSPYLVKVLGCKLGYLQQDLLSQDDFVYELNSFLIRNKVILQANLVSNIYTVLTDFPGKDDIGSKSFLKKFRHHPLVSLIIAEGVEIMRYLPQTILSADDYVVTGYTLEQELQVLITILLENNFSLQDIRKLLTILNPYTVKNGNVVSYGQSGAIPTPEFAA